MNIFVISLAAVSLSMCKGSMVINDFCKQIDAVGHARLLNKAEGEIINLERKRALLALRKAYVTQCGSKQ